METITIDEFVERLGKYKGHYIVAILEGNIDTEIDMDLAKINKEEDSIEIVFNKTKRKISGENLKINIHQIKNIESDEEKEFYIYFDSKQRIIFFTDMKVLLNYKLLKWEKTAYYISKASI